MSARRSLGDRRRRAQSAIAIRGIGIANRTESPRPARSPQAGTECHRDSGHRVPSRFGAQALPIAQKARRAHRHIPIFLQLCRYVLELPMFCCLIVQ
ncbi:hypothetical protein [Scytonema sp. HK-05]|uniref:hypothetical protein n=1 Tax=Scytonema sp. HK-05 TaxID=1137095 RepID=UPI0011611D1F|nr:hypothetical protein [Scytonema sp. HK-05]